MPADERKVITVLFVDVAESTALADSLDAEDLRDVMSGWFAAVRAEIEACGGTVEKYIGDAVMAVFGVPRAHEDDAARALRAALGIRTRLQSFNAELAATHGISVEIRTGVNTGEAIATPDPAPGEPMVTGAAVNAAARLEQLAGAGQTLVSERTVRASRGFRFDDLGLVDLRGARDRARAFALLGAEDDAPERGLPGARSPLVGRERELELLRALQERVLAERRPHLATLYGDPGVGKSRLVRELLGVLARSSEPPAVHIGRCLSYGEGIAYWPLAEILRDIAGIADDDPAAVALARVGELVDGLLADTAADVRSLTTAALAFTLGLDSGDPAFARLHPSAIRVELQRAWRAALSALSLRRPLVVVVEDIHWADPVLLDLLEEVTERSQGSLLVICSSRPDLLDTRPTWGGGRRSFSSLVLAPLDADAARALVNHLLDVDGLPDGVRDRILERAEGNPFFLEEILRRLIDEGLIVRTGDRFEVVANLTDVELPDTVQGVLAARIDLLEPAQKRALQQASVVGRTFWRGAVSALLDDDRELDADLRRLEARELIAARTASSLLGEEEFAFGHILTRDVAYQTLPRRDRPRAHVRVAGWIERTSGDRRGEFVGLLAHHLLEAYRGTLLDRSADPEELERLRLAAQELLIDAGRSARRGGAHLGARALAQSALDIAVSPAERARALELLGDAYRDAALGDEAYRSYTEAVDTLLEAGSEHAESVARLCGLALEQVCRWAGTMADLRPEAEAARYLDEGLRRLGAGDSESRVRLQTVEAFWWHSYRATDAHGRDPEYARALAAGAAAAAERMQRPDLVLLALDAVQHNLQRQMRFGEAFEVALHRLEIARTAGDLGELGDSFAVAAWAGIYVGDFARAWTIGHEGYELMASNAPLLAAHCLAWTALASYRLGEWDRLLAESELLQARLGERGETPTSGFAASLPAVAYVHEVRGDRPAADRVLEIVDAIERRRGIASYALFAEVVRTLVVRGELAAARRRLEAGRTVDPGLEPLNFLAEAELLIAEGRLDEAPALAARMRRVGAESGARYLHPAALRLDGLATATDGDLDAAVSALDAAAAGFDELGMRIDAATARLDAASSLSAAGRRPDAAARLDAARAPLEAAGHRFELARLAALARTVGGG